MIGLLKFTNWSFISEVNNTRKIDVIAKYWVFIYEPHYDHNDLFFLISSLRTQSKIYVLSTYLWKPTTKLCDISPYQICVISITRYISRTMWLLCNIYIYIYIYIVTVVYSMSDNITVLFPHIPPAYQRPVFGITWTMYSQSEAGI